MNIKPGLYRHYKGNKYEVFYAAQHSETEEWMVVYRALYGDFGIWVRPADMFKGTVRVEELDVPRFAFQADTVPDEFLLDRS